MKKQILIVFFTIFIIIFSLFVFPTVGADSVTDVVATPGAVNCIVSFNCTDSTDSIKIYYDTSASVTTGDSSTYTDPDTCSKSNRVSRKMLIRGLTEDTTYYYRLYSTDDTDWCAVEGSFTTLPRFTAEWKDEFFDTYLIDASSGLELEQNPGDKSGILIGAGTQGYNDIGYTYVTMLKEGDTYMFWGNPRPTNEDNTYFTSNDGVVWNGGSPDGERMTLPTGYVAGIPWNWYGNFLNDSGVWKIAYLDLDDTLSKTVLKMATSSYPNTSFINFTDPYDPLLSETQITANELHISGFYYNSLGAEKWIAYGQQGSTPRKVGMYAGFNDTDWIAWNTDIAVPEVNGGEIYVFPHMIKSGVFIGMNHQFKDDLNTPYLSVSRNGYNGWTNFDTGTPIVPRGAGGQWDDGPIYTAWGSPIIFSEGDYDYLYFGNSNGVHSSPGTYGVGRMTFRKDGITDITPTGSTGWFRTTTIPSNFISNFTVNGNFTATAKLNISVLNATTNLPFDGFSFSDFTTITTNSTSITPAWGSNSLSDIPDANFKLNFSLDGVGSGELFSYNIENYSRSGDTLQFISIDDGTNGTTIYNSTPTINWTVVADTSQYNLQIDNNADFSSPEINITDINQYNYPSNCAINSTRVSFTLPTGLVSYDTYYMRVITYTR